MKTEKISRRDFLKLLGVTTVALSPIAKIATDIMQDENEPSQNNLSYLKVRVGNDYYYLPIYSA